MLSILFQFFLVCFGIHVSAAMKLRTKASVHALANHNGSDHGINRLHLVFDFTPCLPSFRICLRAQSLPRNRNERLSVSIGLVVHRRILRQLIAVYSGSVRPLRRYPMLDSDLVANEVNRDPAFEFYPNPFEMDFTDHAVLGE